MAMTPRGSVPSLTRRGFLAASAALGAVAAIWPRAPRSWAQQESGAGHLVHEDDSVAVWWAESTQKVGRGQPLENIGNHAPRLAAARREREAFQVVIRPKVAVRSLRLNMSDLRGSSRISSKHVRFERVRYVRVSRPSGPQSLGGGLYADRLEPFIKGDLEPGRNHSIWVTIDVPAGTSSDDYDGVLTLSGEGMDRVLIRLRLTVHPFSLPSSPSVATTARLWRGRIDRFDPEAGRTDYRGYYDNLREHRLTGVNILERIRVIDRPGRPLELDSADFDRAADYVIDELGYSFTGFPGLRIASHKGTYRFPRGVKWNGIRIFQRDDGAALTEEFAKRFKSHSALIAQHLRRRGWLDKCYVNLVDELATHDPLTVKKMAAVFGALKDADSQIRILCTSAPVGDLYPFVDQWVVHGDWWRWESTREAIDAALEAGEKVWIYHNSLPLIDHPAIRSRLLPWVMWNEGISGSMSWWTVTSWYEGVTNFARQRWAGNGVLLYPPRPPLAGGSPHNSIRWELFRKGLEDYEYFKRLSDDVDKGRARRNPSSALRRAVEEGDRALEDAMALVHGIPRVSGPWDAPFEPDPTVYERVKRRVATAIVDIKRNL